MFDGWLGSVFGLDPTESEAEPPEFRAENPVPADDHGCHDGDKSLAGDTIACALNACIAKLTKDGNFIDMTFSEKCFTLDLLQLIRAAGLEPELKPLFGQDELFRQKWSTVNNWTEVPRDNSDLENGAALVVDSTRLD